MKLLLFSDVHRDLDACRRLVAHADEAGVDVAVGAGDLATMREGLEEVVGELRAMPAPTVLVPGNGESDAELEAACEGWDDTHVLHGSGARIDGVPFWEDVLSEREAYRIRRETFPGGLWWDPGAGPWVWRLHDDLDRRVMLPDDAIGDTGMSWDGHAYAGQLDLQQELQRRWLLWRDEEIRGGTTEPDALRSALLRRQRSWERSPHPDHGGRTPVEVGERERRRKGR